MSQVRNQRLAGPVGWSFPFSANVEVASQAYGSDNFLGLPLEVRLLLWKIMRADIHSTRREIWYRKINTDYDELRLTCRQIYHEVQDAWCHHIVPFNRLERLLRGVINRTTIRTFKSLTLELRFDMHPQYQDGLCLLLWKARPILKELRLYFEGCDKRGRRVYAHGCGTLAHETSEVPLLGPDQYDLEQLPLFEQISELRNLRVLVISNTNAPLFQSMFLVQKPKLRFLYISTDPRSNLQRRNINEIGRLIQVPTVSAGFPPVKVLHIPSNAAWTSLAVATSLAPTLEHLSWTVRDSSFKIEQDGVNEIDHTSRLFRNLSMYGNLLQSLRFCFAGAGLYEADRHCGQLIGALKHCLPRLQRLRHLELHMKSKSWWLGKEIIAAMAPSVERLFITDRMIHPLDLFDQIGHHMGGAMLDEHRLKKFDHDIDHSSCYNLSAIGEPKSCPREQMRGGKSVITLINPISFRYLLESTGVGEQVLIARRKDTSGVIEPWDTENDPLLRRDFIRFNACLRFVHFEFDVKEVKCESLGNTTASDLLYHINGRLLDRYRNRHLGSQQAGIDKPGQHLPFKQVCESERAAASQLPHSQETSFSSIHLEYRVLLFVASSIECQYPRDVAGALAELSASPLTDDEQYFGNEQEAMQVFHEEPVTTWKDLEMAHYPYESSVLIDGRCHWMSPEYPVPSLTEMEADEEELFP